MTGRARIRPLAGIVVAALLSTAGPARAAFVDIGAGLTGVSGGALAWGDYDGDGDLDAFVAGTPAGGARIARVYRNTSGVFTDAGAMPTGSGVSNAAAAWGDYDRDGDLDLALCGNDGVNAVSRVYRNDAGFLQDIGAGLTGVSDGALGWADYDLDGDLDLALAGGAGGTPVARLYRNDGGLFTAVSAGLAGVTSAALAWGDYDVDGAPDLVIAGASGTIRSTTLYRNSAGAFVAVAAGLPGVATGELAWGDCDNDGDSDLLVTGTPTGSAPIARIYRNNGGSFADIGAGLQGVQLSGAAWGDRNNDGNPDLVLAGSTGSIGVTVVYENNGSTFTDISAGLPGLTFAAVAWGDYDNDRDLDLLVAGNQSGVAIARIYRNDGVAPNDPPGAPTGLGVVVGSTWVTFGWNAASDAQGDPEGLTYNLLVATGAHGRQIMPAMANPADGFRRVAQIGNVGHRRQWSVLRSALGGDSLHWAVQAVDPSYAGSAFATGASGVLAVGDGPAGARLALRLAGPNPFRDEARIAFVLPRAARIRLAVHDAAGRRVRTLVAGDRSAGSHQVRWAGDDNRGRPVGPGIYFVRLADGQNSASLRVLKLD